jgi:hypothetical protein
MVVDGLIFKDVVRAAHFVIGRLYAVLEFLYRATPPQAWKKQVTSLTKGEQTSPNGAQYSESQGLALKAL